VLPHVKSISGFSYGILPPCKWLIEKSLINSANGPKPEAWPYCNVVATSILAPCGLPGLNFGTIRCEALVLGGVFEVFLGLWMAAGDCGDCGDDLKKENKEDDFWGGGEGVGVGSTGTGLLSCSIRLVEKRLEVETADSSVS